MPIDLYHIPGSAPCHAVRLVAAASGVELNLKLLNLLEGEHLKPEFVKMNPQHTVPTINDNGFILWESRAICTYLIDKYAKDDSLYPKDPKKRGLINQRLYFDLGTFYLSFGNYLYPQLRENAPAEPEKLEKCYDAAEFLNKFLEGQTYVAGNHLTVADLVLITSAACFTVIDFDFSKYPNVQRWMKKIQSEAPKYNEIVGEGVKGFKAWVDNALKK